MSNYFTSTDTSYSIQVYRTLQMGFMGNCAPIYFAFNGGFPVRLQAIL